MTQGQDAPQTQSSFKYLFIGAGAAVLLVAIAAGAMFWMSSPALAPERAPVAEAPAPAPPPAPAPAPAPETTPPPAAATPRPRPAPRASAAPPAEAPAAAPAAPAGAMLRVQSDVPGAMVFVNREYLGTTPLESTAVKPGTHRLNVSAEGYEGHTENITMGTDPVEVSVRFKEVRISETLSVVHKHGMGSCQGRLLADVAGLRYDTPDRGDAFTVRYADLEAFDVDYLKKNLRVKARGGRTYNFTDPKEQADPLFVFHKNVQAARARLARGDAPASR